MEKKAASSDFDIIGHAGMTLYHGSKDGEITIIDPYANIRKEGLGFYTTENKDEAQRSADGRSAKGEGKVTKVEFPQGVRVLDMDAEADIEMWNDIADRLDVAPEFKGRNMDAYHELINTYNEDNLTRGGQYVVEEILMRLGFDASTYIENKRNIPNRVFLWKNEFKLPEIKAR